MMDIMLRVTIYMLEFLKGKIEAGYVECEMNVHPGKWKIVEKEMAIHKLKLLDLSEAESLERPRHFYYS